LKPEALHNKKQVVYLFQRRR